MEGVGGGGGLGAVQQSMIQSKMAKEGGSGGVVNLTEPVKGVNTSVVSAQTGNIDQVGQQVGGAMGLLSGNFLEGMLKLSDLSALGLPNVVQQVQEFNSELSQTAHRVAAVLRLEGVSPPSHMSGAAIVAPDSTPSMGSGHGHGYGIE
ncbi:hypothetical protein NHE_0624 [Neorickettsia helminthoeca str. Oregon]|uniref:Uncharacterized protein n=1 Tax=Neorickettsia helminthoeca str. Oregon TaxID=1286528 RepID=X5HKJ0_9RICK|nr:hypothetical protein [Neorickettsia helminthoeca]AHX11559.1 hypothetical protein NHE_0624 [Neorickettsia helminthoeca str. Oregon]